MSALIAILAGDGVGPEVTDQAVRVLEAASERSELGLSMERAWVGGSSMDAQGVPLTEETLELCRRSDAVLLGAVGGPRWDHLPPGERPESGLLRLRKELRLYANLRPVTWHPSLLDTSPLKPELLRGVDLLFVRELTGGIYFGQKRSYADRASDLCEYTVEEIERVVRLAGQLAQRRRRKLTSIDKANVLQTSRLWRETTRHIIESEFPDLELEHLLVDAAAMHLVRRPAEFDVIVTENMFGDILSDEASVLAGSMGMLPSASLGSGRQGLYEPVHGSAPDIAGQGIANPYAAILSAAMLLRHSLGREHEAKRVEKAVFDAISGGALTADIAGAGIEPCSTAAAGDAVLRALAA